MIFPDINCGVFSPQSDCSHDSGFSGGIMDHPAEISGDSYIMSNLLSDFNGMNILLFYVNQSLSMLSFDFSRSQAMKQARHQLPLHIRRSINHRLINRYPSLSIPPAHLLQALVSQQNNLHSTDFDFFSTHLYARREART